MNDTEIPNSRGARACIWSFRLALTGVVFLIIGLIGAQAGLLPMLAMLLLTIGSLIVIIGGISGATGLIASKGTGGGSSPAMAWSAVALGVAALLNAGMMMGGGGAPIHDISTDTVDPPQFVAVAALRGPDDNPIEYAAESAEIQAAAYPDIETIVLLDPRSFVFETALQVVDDMGWEIVDSNLTEGRIEATASTPYVGFKDDVVIRVRAARAETLVDVRSKSRIGRGDMGANAARIRAFRDNLIEAASP